MHPGTVARCAAGCIAAVAWLGLVIQCVSTFQVNQSVWLTLWIVFAYFTILTNLLVAVVFTALAVERTRLRASWIVAGTMLSILLVGIIYALLLHGTMELSGGSAVANVLNHMATPVLVPLFWIIFTRKGELRLIADQQRLLRVQRSCKFAGNYRARARLQGRRQMFFILDKY